MIFCAPALTYPRVQGSIYEFNMLPRFGKLGKRERTAMSPFASRAPAVPVVGIVRNPRSHRNEDHAAEMADCSNILTEMPGTREELYQVLAGFARRGIDYLVVDGGDGTVRDVLTCGATIFGDDWPRMIVLPKGKTNALAVDLGLPNEWSLTEAMAAARDGQSVERRPLRVSPADGSGGCVQGFFLGTGAFALGTEVGQEAHRRGAFNSFAVGLIILWAMIQTLFGGSHTPWRSCTPTRITDRETGASLPHSGRGRADERFMTIATTFEKFPLGAHPFGRNAAPGLKLAVIDWPVRWLILLLPAILFGFSARFLERNGARRFAVSDVDFDLGGSFILDGESFPAGRYILDEGPLLSFVVP